MTDQQIIADLQRQARVASLLLRRLTAREIVGVLPRSGILEPSTGRPYGVDVIKADIALIESEWTEESSKARLLAETREARKEAWAQKKVTLVLDTIKQEMAMVGEEIAPLEAREERQIECVKLSKAEFGRLLKS